MATIHYTDNWQFQVVLPDGNKPKFTKLLDAIEKLYRKTGNNP